jgi:hypothetical protein
MRRRVALAIAVVLCMSLLAFASLTLSNGLKIDNSGNILVSMAGGLPNITTSQGFPLDSSGNLLVDCAAGCATGSGNLSGTWSSTGNVVTTDGSGTAQDGGTALSSLAVAANYQTTSTAQAAYSGIGSCTNKAVTAANANTAPTCTTITSAYVDSSVATAAGTYESYTSQVFGTSSTLKYGAWTTPAAITVTGFDLYVLTPPVGCSTFAVVQIYDNTASAEVGSFSQTFVITNNFYSQVTGSTNVAAGHTLTFRISTAASGCSTNAASIEATLTYVMQAN